MNAIARRAARRAFDLSTFRVPDMLDLIGAPRRGNVSVYIRIDISHGGGMTADFEGVEDHDRPINVPPPLVECPWCQRVFDTGQALATHAKWKHPTLWKRKTATP